MLIRTSLLAIDQAAQVRFQIGDGLDLWLDDRRLGARQDDREVAIRLTGEGIPDDLRQVYVRGQIGAVPLDLAFDPQPNMVLNHLWDGSSQDANAPGNPIGITTEVSVGWEMAASFPRPKRIKWWRKPVVIGGIDQRSLGCGGVSPDSVHQYDVRTDILWRGDGSRRPNALASQPRHVSRLNVLAKEIAIADGAQVHVFDRNGTFRRSLSTLKGHEVASARTDEAGRIISWDRLGHRYTIDRRNDFEAMLRSPAGVWAVLDFDDRGRCIGVTDQDKSTATLEYSESGGLSRVVDSAGLVTEMQRDELGRVVQFRDSTGRRLDLVRTKFDGGSEVTVLTAEGRETKHRSEQRSDGAYVESHSCCGAPNPQVSEYRSLGPLGDEQTVRTPSGMIATIRRGTRADKLREVDVMRTAIVSPSGRTLNIEKRTDRHRTGRTTETVINGESTSEKKLDPKTHTIESTSSGGRSAKTVLVPGEEITIEAPGSGDLRIEFDPVGRARRRERESEVMHYGYDQNGRLTWADFERWRQHIHHNEQGRVNAIETPDGWLQIARDPAGRVSALKAPQGAVTAIDRRKDGAIAAIIYPEGEGVAEFEEMAYDRDGLLIAHRFNGEHLVEYGRDASGRVATISSPGTSLAAAYDEGSGQLRQISSSDGENIRFDFDGDLEWAEETIGRSSARIERIFDDNHRVVARNIGGHQLAIGYSVDGAVTSVGPLNVERQTSSGRVIGLQMGGLTTSRDFDKLGRVVKQETRYGRLARAYFSEEIDRDGFGRVRRVIETVENQQRIIEYNYSDARRLESVTTDGVETLRLGYDSNGNITELTRNGRTLEMDVDGADRLVTVAGQPVSHNAQGMLTAIGVDGAMRGYTFDGLGRLVGTQDPKHSVTHALDAVGRPARISGAGAPKRLFWDGNRLAATLDESGNVDIRFLDSATSACPDGFLRHGVDHLMIKDHLGSIRMVVNAQDGQVIQQLNYDALGRPTLNTAPGVQPFGFAGGLHETVGGIVRFQSRVYDPFIGRFLSRDPLGFAGGQVNLYQYALGDPVNNIDPSGKRVGPTGDINPARPDFVGSRPLAADHVYMQSNAWVSGMKPITTLGTMGRLLSNWTVDSTYDDVGCRTLQAVTQGCFDNSIYEESPLDVPWTQTDRCFGPEWNAMDVAANPVPWEFVPAAWDEGSSLGERLDSASRLPDRIKAFRSSKRDRVSTFLDSL